ncbi:MAG: LysM peptidoglycan-binding domain-containing M23 family metallopeptidase [bacterium]|jgi:lipoprotein NlpD|nr:LysM peptidoglycan-binding domain-containing M23 family metallopeptidase [bacterium]
MNGLKVFSLIAVVLLLTGCFSNQRKQADVPIMDGVMHTVHEGETLAAIADTYKVTPEALQRINNVQNPDRLQAGTRLFIPGAAEIKTVAVGRGSGEEWRRDGLYHTVAPGETLAAISRAYGISLRELQRNNSISDPSRIRVGQRLWVPRAIEVKDVNIPTPTIVSAPADSTRAQARNARRHDSPVASSQTSTLTKAEQTEPTEAATPAATAQEKPKTPVAVAATTPAQQVPTPEVKTETKPETKAPEVKEEPKPQEQAVEFPREITTFGSMRFQWPLKGDFAILRAFNKSTNLGIDLGANIGTPVCSAGDGEVVFVGSVNDDLGNSFGNFIIIYHGQRSQKGVRTIYAHNSENRVEVGQKVKRGEQIALVGNTGMPYSKEGGVLHFRFVELDECIDPQSVLPLLKK